MRLLGLLCAVLDGGGAMAVEPAIPVAPAPDGGGAPLPVPSSLLDMVIGSVKLRIGSRISSLVSMAQM